MSTDDYEVGYGKPPKHSQWLPGESGNKGRKKKLPPNFISIVQAVRDEMHEVNGKKVTGFELAVRSTFAKTIKSGKPRDLKLLLEIIDKYGGIPEIDRYAETKAGGTPSWIRSTRSSPDNWTKIPNSTRRSTRSGGMRRDWLWLANTAGLS
jgi:hypothetical protein